MAVGCAVVVCDFAGLGQKVRPQTFAELRALNFEEEFLLVRWNGTDR